MKLAISNTQMATSFTDMVTQHMPALKAYCRSLTKSTWDADDLMQETLLKAYKSWKDHPRELSKAFFIRIASNTWIDQYRKKTLLIEENQNVHDLKHEADTNTEDIQQTLEWVIKQLSPKQRATLLLTEGLGMSASETAKFMGESVGAVKAALHRARKKLKDFEGESVTDTEEGTMIPYLDALHEGSPESIVRLYQQEITPTMCLDKPQPFMGGSIGYVMGSNGTSYVLLTVTLKNGKQLIIPFYQKERLAILAYLEEGLEWDVLAA